MIVDLFAGAGGLDEAIRLAGFTGDTVGIECDAAACAAAEAAGHDRICADVTTYDRDEFAGLDGLVAGPPCQPFSQGGLRLQFEDARGALVWQPLRWALRLRPRFVLCEQVPPVLPVWQQHSAILRSHGYATWTGVVNAADFGVPQVRKRAILLARRDGIDLAPPAPTHGADADDGLFSTLAPWVTMADALGWGMTARPYFTLAAARHTGGPDKEKVGGSGARKALYAERAAERWIDPVPAEHDGAIRVRVQDAAVLQGFRRDYPWHGTATQQYRQLSNAVPPPLAAALLRPLLARQATEQAAS